MIYSFHSLLIFVCSTGVVPKTGPIFPNQITIKSGFFSSNFEQTAQLFLIFHVMLFYNSLDLLIGDIVNCGLKW